MSGRTVRRGVTTAIVAALVSSACGSSDARIDATFGDQAAATVPSTTARPTTVSTTIPPTTTTITTTTTAPTSTTSLPIVVPTSTTAPTTTLPSSGLRPIASIPAAAAPKRTPVDPWLTASNAAFDRLAANNVGASMSIVRGGELVYSNASGTAIDGTPATGDTPFVVASVSKLVVGVALARLQQQGIIDVNEVVPWGEIGIWPGPGWVEVTLWELMNHSAGVPVARSSWFSGGTECAEHIVGLVSGSPRGHRGAWTYSNGNYCLLGLVVAARTGLALDEAVQHLVFDPVGATGVHLTTDGLLPDDMTHPHGAGVQRLSRLGGAGTLVVSTDDLALAIGRLTAVDVETVRRGVFVDQYGFGHTGTVDGAKACTWWLDGGDTVVSATIAGDGRSTGGAVCDLVVPALATDLGINDGRPRRSS